MNRCFEWQKWTATIAALVVLSLSSACRSFHPTEAPSIPDSIFDSHTLRGWTQRGGKANYSVEDACIVGRTAPNQPNSFLCTDRVFRDFELTFEFKVDQELNSGVQIRSELAPGDEGGRVRGYQIEIDPSPRAWTGGVYEEGRRGWLQDLKDKSEARSAFRPGAWNHVRVRAVGPRIQTWLNGVPAADLLDSAASEGFVALQVHGVGARAVPLEVRWRAIKLKELSLQ